MTTPFRHVAKGLPTLRMWKIGYKTVRNPVRDVIPRMEVRLPRESKPLRENSTTTEPPTTEIITKVYSNLRNMSALPK